MAVEVDDLLAPSGPVEVTLFPGEDIASESDPTVTVLEERLAVYIGKAEEKVANEEGVTDPDRAIELWALHLTFQAAYIFSCTHPATENTMVAVLGSQTYTKDQRDALKAQADFYLSQYGAVITAAGVSSDDIYRGAESRQITNKFEW